MLLSGHAVMHTRSLQDFAEYKLSGGQHADLVEYA